MSGFLFVWQEDDAIVIKLENEVSLTFALRYLVRLTWLGLCLPKP